MHTTRRARKHQTEPRPRIPLFADCTIDELARIDQLGAQVDVPAGRALTREGSGKRECFVTLAGTAVAQRDGRPIGVIGPGSIIGEMALLDGTIRNATVVADTPMRVLALDPSEFAQLLEIAPSVDTTLRRIADDRRAAFGR
jgi:CRP/FNR family transcriptional regulator, cyclic AMP receptor protein